jgi:hypothetical protein
MDLTREKFIIGLFAAFGVGLILWQHAQHTGQIIQAMGGLAPTNTNNPSVAAGSNVIYPASLGGTPAPGQPNLSAEPPPLDNLVIGPNWSIR